MSMRSKKIACSALCAVLIVGLCGFSFVFADSFTDLFSGSNGGIVSFPSDNTVRISSSNRYQPTLQLRADYGSLSVSFTSDTAYSNGDLVCRCSAGYHSGVDTFELVSAENVYLEDGKIKYSGSGQSGSFELNFNNAYASGSYLNFTPHNSGSSSGMYADFTFSSLSVDGEDIIGIPVEPRTFRLSLPYGNVLRIYSDSDFTITNRAYSISDATYNYQKYVRASDNFSYRVNGSYQGVVSNSSLSGTFGPSVFGSDNVMNLLIPWQPTNQNVLGRATDYNYYNGSPDPTANVSVSSSQSFLIWYPYYANNQDTSKINEVPMNVSITIETSGSISFMTYPITGSTSSLGEDTYISNTASSSDSGTTQQTSDSDGNINVTFDNAPSAGGNHGQAPINQNNSILGVLSNLQNTLLGLFNKAIDGIHNLISLGSSFLQSVQVMFSWLPAELLVIITSGFVILLTIGVLKTLWR